MNERVKETTQAAYERQRMNLIQHAYTALMRSLAYLTPAELDTVDRAFVVARDAHGPQIRKSGEPYITHPIAIAQTLADMHMDAATVAAALLHDVIEDTPTTYKELADDFGDEIAQLVLGVTKLNAKVEAMKRVRAAISPDLSYEEQEAASLANLFLAMTVDLRVMIIKLADRLHNMHTIHGLKPYKQRRMAQETLDLFVPLAARLGIWNLKQQLEDLSLHVIEPETFDEISDMLAARKQLLIRDLEDTLQQLRLKLQEDAIPATVSALSESASSLYHHIQSHGWESTRTYDGFRIQVVVDTRANCYAALGSVHELWSPVPGRIVDYIAAPKEGLYRSLHTVVMGLRGHPIEVRIRTQQMQQLAERGVAAYLEYGHQQATPDLPWLAEVAELPDDDPETFLDLFKSEITPERIRVFTPKGDVVDLPAGSTPLDFAYAVHTEVGHSCRRAIVNNQYVPLNTPLKSGDQVEIQTTLTQEPDRDWLDTDLGYARHPDTLRRIRRWFSRQPGETAIEQGREIIEEEILTWGECDGWTGAYIHRLARRRGMKVDDFALRVGRGELFRSDLATFILEEVLAANEEVLGVLTIEIDVMDRPLFLRDAFEVVAQEEVNLHSAWGRASEETGLALVQLTLDTPDIRKIVRIVHRLAHLPSALRVRRSRAGVEKPPA
ncbi:MAG: bifunctional (p)ppGpp synthetase/guanosine-3',5'-bis(diphosphate) 3'-pyrophosphohydrolase [Anaerolineae bacterium]|nr:bifunctional (p)ppGpp synthetase/guanosine-3',5'-bis(diphosphate) 3'-pyrophosphohydrolase [Anaerolineae bacterium]